MQLNQVFHGDCLDVMTDIPDNSVDMILCDLPYGITARNKWDIVIPFEPLWEQYLRVTKKNAAIVLTAVQPFASRLILSNEAMFRYDLVWKKNTKSGFLNAKKMPLRSHEQILVFYQKLPIYNPQKTTGHKLTSHRINNSDYGNNYGKTKKGISCGGNTDRYPESIIYYPSVPHNIKDKVHPTQKPVGLFEYLIKTYTDEGMTVLDNCAGACTTAIACNNLGRNWICIEKEQEYYDAGIKRIQSGQPAKPICSTESVKERGTYGVPG